MFWDKFLPGEIRNNFLIKIVFFEISKISKNLLFNVIKINSHYLTLFYIFSILFYLMRKFIKYNVNLYKIIIKL